MRVHSDRGLTADVRKYRTTDSNTPVPHTILKIPPPSSWIIAPRHQSQYLTSYYKTYIHHLIWWNRLGLVRRSDFEDSVRHWHIGIGCPILPDVRCKPSVIMNPHWGVCVVGGWRNGWISVISAPCQYNLDWNPSGLEPTYNCRSLSCHLPLGY